MKTVAFDVDGTLVDYKGFVDKYAVPYFEKKYRLHTCKPNELEIEDVFSMVYQFKEMYQCSEADAQKQVKRALDKFWLGIPYIKYTLFWKFRPGVQELCNELQKQGFEIEIHTSRAKTTEKNVVGKIARILLFLQLWKNGLSVPRKKIFFYKNDNEKLFEIIRKQPICVFEDKPDIVQEIEKRKLSVFCVAGTYNKCIQTSKWVTMLQDFNKENIKEQIKKITGKREFEYYKRAKDSSVYFKKLTIFRPMVLSYFKPIILHDNNIIREKGNVLYVSNHRTTLDPLVITGYLNRNIHWAALKRFFEAKDSIFNNSKNPILCKITAAVFKRLEYFPIERKWDNEEANNYQAIKDMCYFLKIDESVGIFPEGTTRRQEGKEFGEFDDSFVLLAKNSEAWVQPITVLWISELKLPQKLILNFGEPFQVKRENSSGEIMNFFLSLQEKGLQENKEFRENLLAEKVRCKKHGGKWIKK